MNNETTNTTNKEDDLLDQISARILEKTQVQLSHEDIRTLLYELQREQIKALVLEEYKAIRFEQERNNFNTETQPTQSEDVVAE